MPRRPLSAFHIFYLLERERTLNGGEERDYTLEDVMEFVNRDRIIWMRPTGLHRRPPGSFQEMARRLGMKWRALDPATRQMFEDCASKKLFLIGRDNENHPRQQRSRL